MPRIKVNFESSMKLACEHESRPAAVGLIPSTEEGDKRGSCTVKSWAWQHIPALSALWSMRQKNEIFKASLGYIPLKQQQNYSLFFNQTLESNLHGIWSTPPFLREKKSRRWGKTQGSNRFCSGLALP